MRENFAVVADTHAVVWYIHADPRLSARAKTTIDQIGNRGDIVAISSIAHVEIVYLIEKGRVPAETLSQLARILNDPLGIFREVPLDLSVARALSGVSSAQIPDMSDRIIAATAVYLRLPLISRDGKIRTSNIQTIW